MGTSVSPWEEDAKVAKQMGREEAFRAKTR
jgi:hypothetical protein